MRLVDPDRPPRRSPREGTALITVLLASAVLLVICMALASVAILDLNVAGSYSTRSQSLLMAGAAVNQVIAELDRAQQLDDGNALDLNDVKKVDLLARFQQNPVFPDGGANFPGDVYVTFDRSLDHFSLDNSYSDGSASGWLDQGSARKSVPPFSIDLLIRTRIGGHTTWWEALLRRRWPYVLCTPGKVTLMGAPTYAASGGTGTVNPTLITGPIFDMPSVAFSPKPPPDATPAPDAGSNVFVEASLINNLLGVMPSDVANVTVGGPAQVRVMNSSGVYGAPVSIFSAGNQLLGPVDISASDGSVAVYPNNKDVGSVSKDVKPANIVKNLQRAFQLPDYGGFQKVPFQMLPPGWTPEPPPQPAASGGPAPSGSPTASPSPSGSPSGGPDPGPPPEPPYFVIKDDVVLNGPDTSNASFQYDPSACWQITRPAGNRYIVNGNIHNVFYTGAGVELHNAMLYIAGNLDLSSTRPPPGAPPPSPGQPDPNVTIPKLRGTNATLIVDGTLILSNGSLEATSSKGMVIYCRRLVSAAKGTYKGLIMVQKSAAICPARAGDIMEIQGGIICGADPVGLFAVNPNWDPASTVSETLSVLLTGLHLWSAHLTYDPKYLKTLNRFGPLSLMALRPVE